MMNEQMKDLCRKLDEDVPAGKLRERQQSGKALIYLEGWYVEDRLNQIFGNLGWSKHTEVRLANVDDKGRVQYVGHVTLSVLGGVMRDGFGAGTGYNNDHEGAVKEAETDALKRAAKSLGRSLGLALYDKDQQHVEGSPAHTFRTKLDECTTPAEVDALYAGLPNALKKVLKPQFQAKKAALS